METSSTADEQPALTLGEARVTTVTLDGSQTPPPPQPLTNGHNHGHGKSYATSQHEERPRATDPGYPQCHKSACQPFGWQTPRRRAVRAQTAPAPPPDTARPAAGAHRRPPRTQSAAPRSS